MIYSGCDNTSMEDKPTIKDEALDSVATGLTDRVIETGIDAAVPEATQSAIADFVLEILASIDFF